MSNLILVVDDDPLARTMLKITLRDPSFESIEARSVGYCGKQKPRAPRVGCDDAGYEWI